ncbi:ABC transporter substrate-binding protein [Pseudochelatococcus sp. B33]
MKIPALRLILSLMLLVFSSTTYVFSQDVKTVRIGIPPFFDYQIWAVARELGLDAEQGISIEPVSVNSGANGVAALRQGSLDLAASSQVGAFPFFKQVPDLRTWIVLDQFKGFIVVGRTGSAETYASLVGKLTPEEAKKQVLESFRGKTFVVNPTNFLPLVKAALDQAGMTLDDVKVAEFPDDAKAALAFETGVGDYYMGSLPQEAKLLSQPDRYTAAGGHEVLGPAGLWFSSTVGLAPWIEQNQETVMKLTAIAYRTIRYLHEQPERTVPIWTKLINAHAAASFTDDEVKNILTLLYHPTAEEAAETFFNPDSDVYWKNSIDYYSRQNAENLPSDFSSGKYNIEEEMFKNFIKRDDLVSWVNSPLK